MVPGVRVAGVGHIEWVDFIGVDRMPRPGEVIHARSAFTRAAGGGGVASVALARLGAEVDFFLALGRDADGKAAAEQLREQGVRTHVAWRSEPTRRAVTLLEHEGERTIVTIGERLEPFGSDELDWARLERADGVYVTAGDAEAMRHARRAQVLVASPRARHGLAEAGIGVDALVFSARDQHELEWAKVIEPRTSLLVATDGANGGRWWGQSEGTWEAVPAPGPARDSYGCGDSFAAAFTYGLASGSSPAKAAVLGARVGAECLTRTGAP
jgi:ribokinase